MQGGNRVTVRPLNHHLDRRASVPFGAVPLRFGKCVGRLWFEHADISFFPGETT
jgi:hypothetical protein